MKNLFYPSNSRSMEDSGCRTRLSAYSYHGFAITVRPSKYLFIEGKLPYYDLHIQRGMGKQIKRQKNSMTQTKVRNKNNNTFSLLSCLILQVHFSLVLSKTALSLCLVFTFSARILLSFMYCLLVSSESTSCRCKVVTFPAWELHSFMFHLLVYTKI